MTIVYPLAYPDWPNPKVTVTQFGARDVVGRAEAPFSLVSQFQRHQGQQWLASIRVPPLTRISGAAELQAFLLSLRGTFGTFTLGDVNGKIPRGLGTTIDAHQNDIPNNTMQGAVVGTIGSGGALPTGWQVGFNDAGFSVDVVNFTTSFDGVDFIDLRFYAPTVVGQINLDITQPADIPAVLNDDRTMSTYVTRPGGSEAGLTDLVLNHSFFNSVLSFIGSENGPNLLPLATIGLSSNRQTFADTVNEVGTASSQAQMVLKNSVITTPDITIRIGLPQDEPGSVATSPIRTSGTALSRPVGPFVEGADQIGDRIILGGFTPDSAGLLVPNDYLQLGTGSGTRLHRALEQLDTDVTGQGTIEIWPSLRESPVDLLAVEINNTQGLWRLAQNSRNLGSLDLDAFYKGLVIEAIEAI